MIKKWVFVISGSHCKEINVGYATKYSNFCHLWRTLFCADLGSEFYTSNVKTFYIVSKYKKVHPLLSDHYSQSKLTKQNTCTYPLVRSSCPLPADFTLKKTVRNLFFHKYFYSFLELTKISGFFHKKFQLKELEFLRIFQLHLGLIFLQI